MFDEPRAHPYGFAHRALPDRFLHDPAGTLDALRSNGNGTLRVMWDEVGADLDAGARESAGGLGVRFIGGGARSIAIVRLPEPKVSPEARYVALVGPGPNGNEPPLCYTLELAEGASWLMGSWDLNAAGDLQHSQLAAPRKQSDPPLTDNEADFLAAVQRLVKPS